MRATLSATYRTLLNNLDKNSSRLNDLRVTTATGKRMQKPSDDPSAIRPVLNARGQIRSSDRFLRTLGTASDRLQTMDTQLNDIENLMIRTKEIVVASGNGSLNSQDLQTLADQIRLVKDELVALGNTKVSGKYIFAGFSENTPPFDGTPGTYFGDNGAVEFEIGPGEKVPVNLTGNDLFLGDFNFDGATDPGGVDLFQTLDDIQAALTANDPNTALAQLDQVDAGLDQVIGFRAKMGNVAQRVDNATLSMEDVKIDMTEMLSRYEDADIIATITDLSQQETAFKAALEVTSKVSQITILDYLR